MKNSQKVLEKLIELASNDLIPSDMGELSPEHFQFLDELKNVGGFTIKDVKDFVENQMEYNVTDDQVDDILNLMEHDFDASVGMKWENIEYYANKVLNK